MTAPAQIAAAKAAHPLAAIIPRYATGPRRVGGRTFWLCPFHLEKTPSFTITPDGGAFVCFGCGAKGDVLDFVEHIEGLDLKGALAFLSGNGPPAAPARAPARPRQDDSPARRSEAARSIWRASSRAEGTPVERYLRRRGLTLSIPATIRHHPGLTYAQAGLRFHAMVAAVQAPGRRIVAVHRTYILADGRKAQVQNPKMTLGPSGGGAVRLGLASDRLIVAEGIETALSAMMATGTPAWAALSTSGLRALVLPPAVREVMIAADGDEAGRQAAREAGGRWTREGVRVRIADPGDGRDFNDLMRGAA